MPVLNAWIETNPVLIGIAVGVAVSIFVCGLIAWMMWRAGQSLKPIVFFVVFMGIVAGPQVVYHVTHVKIPASPTGDAVPSAASRQPEPDFAVENGAFADLKQVFGQDVDPDLVRDAKPVFPDVVQGASIAQLAFKPSGETVLAAAFPDAASASEAARAYLRFFQIVETSGDEASGWTAPRSSAQDHVRVVAAGRMLMAWTGSEPEKLAEYQAATLGIQPGAAHLQAELPTLAVGFALDRMFAPWWMKAGGILLNLSAAVFWFFWGTTWASSTRPAPGVAPVAPNELRSRLLAINAIECPVSVEASDDGKTIIVTWRYADARWVDMAQARGLRRTHRLALRLDERQRCVKVREYWSEFDWSAGRGGANIRWKAAMGIMFLQYEHERVFGLQFGPDWKPTASLTYSYTFNLQELKQPLMDAVVGSGWTWKPVMLPFPLAR